MKYRYYALIGLAISLLLLSACSESSTTPQAPPPSVKAPVTSFALEERVSVYKDVLSKDPKNLDALIGLGNTYMDNKRFTDAIDAYQMALDITPDNVNVRIDMGTCYRSMGQPERAIEEYKKGLTYEPNHSNGLANLGIVLAYDLNDNDGAIQAWEKLLQVSPNHQMASQIRQEVARLKSTKPQTAQ